MMTRTTVSGWGLLLVLAGGSVAQAQQVANGDSQAMENTIIELGETPPPKLDFPEPDWSLLDTSVTPSDRPVAQKRAGTKSAPDPQPSWSEQARPNGAAALTVKQPVAPFWDARIGADMTVVNQPSTMSEADLLQKRFSFDGLPGQSGGTAWAAVTAPGVGSFWDKTAIEARVDPTQDQSKLTTSLSKSVPLAGEQYSLTLENGYNVIQQSMTPVVGITGHVARNYETDQAAKLSIADTGTSFIAGQSLSSTDDKWLRKIGAEQKVFGDVSITGSISETTQGTPNRSLTAGFKHSW
jgi:hypothetical protein